MAKREIPEINAGSMADIAFLLLIFFLVTTTMEKDTAYIRYIPKKIEVEPVEIAPRNTFEIKANAQNRLMIRGEIIENPDDISDRVLEFFQMNEGLSEAQTKNLISDKSYKGFNFPFYSRVSLETVESEIDENDQLLSEAEDADDQDYITFYDKALKEWGKKKAAITTLNVKELKEIHPQAHIRIVVQPQTEYKLFAKIHSEIQEALVELRDKAAMKYFGESYKKMTKRLDQDKSDEKGDKKKVEALKVLYPERVIEVRPK